MATKYPYNPLSPREIRLLNILPGSPSDELICGIITVDLESSPPYEALSYVWGSPTQKFRLKCDPGEVLMSGEPSAPVEGIMCTDTPSHSIGITENLRDALIHLRQVDDMRTLWVDAVCINQDDIPERESQVSMMGEIYFATSQGLIWLGKEDEHTLSAFQFIDRAIELQDVPVELFRVEPTRDDPVRPWLLPEGSPAFFREEHWHAYLHLLARPWFERAWVFQEAVLPRSLIVHIGGHLLEWEKLSITCQFVHKLRIYVPTQKRDLFLGGKTSRLYTTVLAIAETRASLRRVLKGNGPGNSALPQEDLDKLSLEKLLQARRLDKATDPRDKAYSLIGLVPPLEKAELRPNYNISVCETFMLVAKILVERRRKKEQRPLKLLSMVFGANPAHGLPSWLPDWSTGNDCNAIANFGEWHTSSTAPCTAIFPFDGNSSSITGKPRLTVMGISLMAIKQVSEKVSGVLPIAWNKDDPSRPENMLNAFPETYPTASALTYEAAYQLATNPARHNELFGGQAPGSSYPTRGFWDYTLACEAGKQSFSALPDRRPYDFWRDLMPDSLYQISGDANYMNMGRCFFVSTFGFMGLVPGRARLGDEICLLFGADVPFVIRREGAHCQFIGDCYVLGVMSGEAMVGIDINRCEHFRFE